MTLSNWIKETINYHICEGSRKERILQLTEHHIIQKKFDLGSNKLKL